MISVIAGGTTLAYIALELSMLVGSFVSRRTARR
jgi:hypothetical protein